MTPEWEPSHRGLVAEERRLELCNLYILQVSSTSVGTRNSMWGRNVGMFYRVNLTYKVFEWVCTKLSGVLTIQKLSRFKEMWMYMPH